MTRLALVRRRFASAWTRRATPDGRLTLWRIPVVDRLMTSTIHHSAPICTNRTSGLRNGSSRGRPSLGGHLRGGHQWEVPVREEDLEASLLLATIGLLVREELLCDLLLQGALGGGRGAPEDDRDAKVPAPVLGRVIPRLLGLDLEESPRLDLFLQHGEVVLPEEPRELIGKTPLRLVVVLDDEGCLGPGGGPARRSNRLGRRRHRDRGQGREKSCAAESSAADWGPVHSESHEASVGNVLVTTALPPPPSRSRPRLPLRTSA